MGLGTFLILEQFDGATGVYVGNDAQMCYHFICILFSWWTLIIWVKVELMTERENEPNEQTNCVFACIRVSIYVFAMSHMYAIQNDNDYLLSDTKMCEFLICNWIVFTRLPFLDQTSTHIEANPQIKHKYEQNMMLGLTPSTFSSCKCCRQHFSHFRPSAKFHVNSTKCTCFNI